MANSETINISQSYTKITKIIDPYQTTNATQQTAYSIAIPQNKAVYVMAVFFASDAGFTSCVGGKGEATFLRASGNLVRSSGNTSSGLLTTILGNFLLGQPSIDLVANTSTQSIDVRVTGKLATTINWRLEVTYYINT